MSNDSAFELATEVKAQVERVLSRIDLDDLPAIERSALVQVKQGTTDARLEARDYDYADTRAAQQAAATDARGYFVSLDKALLNASQYGYFGPVEVAEISAKIQKIITLLQ